MSHPFYYAAIQARDERAFMEFRTVGVVMIAPDGTFARIKSVPLGEKLGRSTDVTTIRAVLGWWESELPEVARRGIPGVLEWLNARVGPSEDILQLLPPSAGVSDDLSKTLNEITREFTGYSPRVVPGVPDRVIADVLRRNRLTKVFHAQTLQAGTAEWKFPFVAGDAILHPLDFEQKQPSGLLDAAFRETGRFDELRMFRAGLDVVAVAAEPQSRTAERVLDLYRTHRIEVVPASHEAVTQAVTARGFLSVGEAK